ELDHGMVGFTGCVDAGRAGRRERPQGRLEMSWPRTFVASSVFPDQPSAAQLVEPTIWLRIQAVPEGGQLRLLVGVEPRQEALAHVADVGAPGGLEPRPAGVGDDGEGATGVRVAGLALDQSVSL